MNLAKFFGHDFNKDNWFRLFDANSNQVYHENSYGFWCKNVFDANGNQVYGETSNNFWYKDKYDSNDNQVYHENSNGYWWKREFDANNNWVYYEESDGTIIDKRPKSCAGKVVEIDDVKYKLTEV